MADFFGFLSIASLILLIVGAIRPRLIFRKDNEKLARFGYRKIATLGFGILFVLFLGIAGSLDKSATVQQEPKQEKIPADQSVATATPSQTVTQEKVDGLVLVTRVIDGDTIEIVGGQKVRYIGIDTPETVDPRKPVQCFGKEATNKNKELVSGKRIRLEKDVSEIDQYGRLLRYVYAGDTFVNLELVKQGFAYAYSYPPDVRYQNQFTDAQRLAREQNKGLWGSCPISTPTPTPQAPTATPVLTSTPIPTQSSQPPQSGGYSVPSCASTDCDCADFSSRAHAQWFYDNYDQNNTHRLDGSDKDGLVCESMK